MNIKTYLEKHNNRTLTDEAWEELAQTLLTAKFDEEKKARWTQLLQANGIERTVPRPVTASYTNVRKYLAAASVTLLLAVATWYFFLQSPLSPAQRMASQYLEQPFQLNQGNTRSEASTELNRGKAYEAFEMKQYEKSLAYLRIIETEGEPKSADFFQMGLCLMYQKTPDYPKAISAFNAAHDLDTTAYADEINWFSGLCHLMKGDETAAAESLKKVIESPSSRNQDAAQTLLNQLGKK